MNNKPTTDCCNNEIIPIRDNIWVERNRHPNLSGTSWGWIEGCSSHICWSDDHAFNRDAANAFVKRHNDKAAANE